MIDICFLQIRLEMNDEAAALSLFASAHDISAKSVGLLSLKTASLAQQVGQLHAKLGRFEDAEEYLTQTASAYDAAYGQSDARAVDAWRTVAMLQLKQRAYERAGTLLTRVVESETELYGDDSVRVADSRKLLGTVQLARQQLDDALDTFRAAHRVYRSTLGDEHAKTRALAKTIASVKEHVADTDELLLRRASRAGGGGVQFGEPARGAAVPGSPVGPGLSASDLADEMSDQLSPLDRSTLS